MAPGNYVINTRVDGEGFTASKNNADHQKHVDNMTPMGVDDYAADSAQFRAQTTPGAALPTSLAGELERLRYVLAALGDVTTWDLVGGPLPPPFQIRLTGSASVQTKVAHLLMPFDAILAKVRLYAETAPSGDDLIVDLLKNGTTVWTSTGHRAKINDGSNSGSQTTFDVPDVLAGDRLSLDIVQVGSGTAGGDDLLVLVEFRPVLAPAS